MVLWNGVDRLSKLQQFAFVYFVEFVESLHTWWIHTLYHGGLTREKNKNIVTIHGTKHVSLVVLPTINS